MKLYLSGLSLILVVSLAQVGTNNLAAQEPIWLSWEAYQIAMEAEPKKAMVYIYTEWCGPCAKMDSSTFIDPKVKGKLDGDFYAVKFNAEDNRSLNFKGESYDFIFSRRKGFHALAFYLAGQKLSYPCFILLDEKQSRQGGWFGYLNPLSFLHLLEFPNQSTDLHPTLEAWMDLVK